MRFSRRGTLRLGVRLAGGALAATALGGSAVPASLVMPLSPRMDRLPFFDAHDHSRTRFGELTFRSGLEINDPYPRFGGFSGLWRARDGARLLAVSDRGDWFAADVTEDKNGLSGLTGAIMAPMLDFHRTPLGRTENYDVEAVTIKDDIAHIGIERTNAIMRFDLTEQRLTARGEFLPTPREMRDWPHNAGPEAIAIAPDSSPYPGAIVVIGERIRRGESAPTRGFILDGEAHHAFDVARHEGFDITDMAFLDNGDVLVLERRYRILRDVGARIRRLPGGDLRTGAVLDGPVIFEAGAGQQIDNMEGLALHRTRDGRLVLSLISDDNFSILQRTLLLEFYYDDAD
ncbi:esterase-like activity of phytase family protein [Saliniramus sp.]|uniref:esterase-like activity of phytase family protein n=1 Tax=Saliniramus sp. TaxID=2986772 RepID=UPI002B9D54D3|nr:esterase-like activity of phytase family protein [Saliniramus sp.]HMB10137.1 esterase-like activity of phytase family protein [Saliniramus sp.]